MALRPLLGGYEGGVAVRANGHRVGDGASGVRWIGRGEGNTVEGRMEEDTELEEGEALEGGGGPSVDDLDLRFGYLDTKIEAVLGDYQREFQGSLINDKLGSKVGCYGSFLPTHVRGPPVLGGPAPAPAATMMPPRARLLEQMERARRMAGVAGNRSTVAPERASKVSPNGTGTKSQMQINGVKHNSERVAMAPAKVNSRKDGDIPVDQKKGRPITVRLNLAKGADKVGKKTLYNGFGLDNSSSPSTDEDPDDGFSASEDEFSPNRSPSEMIRVMTSFVPPHGGLLSPFCDPTFDLLPRERKEKPLSNSKLRKQGAGSQAIKAEPGPGLGAGAVPVSVTAPTLAPAPLNSENDVGKEFKVKEKTDKVKGKGGNRREATPVLDSGKVGKKEMDTDGRIEKDGGGIGQKGFHKVGDKVGMRDLDLKGEKAERDVDARDVPWKEVDTLKDSAKSARKEVLNVTKDSVKAKREEEALPKDSLKQPFRKDAGRQVEAVVVDRDISNDGALEVKKKNKEISKGPQAQKEAKDKLRDAPKDGRKETKKDNRKEVVRDIDDNGKEEAKDSSRSSVREAPKEMLKEGKRDIGSEHSLKEARAAKKAGKKAEKEPMAVHKESERDSMARSSFHPGGDDFGAQSSAPQPLPMPLPPALGADAPAGSMVPAGQLVLDHWVLCDSCQKWRLLIPTIHPDDLPDNWLCKMMTWLPGLNNCKFSEDVTTAAVYKLLGLQNPTLAQGNPGLQAQAQLHPVAPVAPPPGLIPDHKVPDAKPAKVNRSGSKKGMGKKVAAGAPKNSAANAKKMEANAGKSRSLKDVGHQAFDQASERTGLEAMAGDDGGYGHVPVDVVRKVKQKDTATRTWENEGEDFPPQKHQVRVEDRNRDKSWPSAFKTSKALVQVPVEVDEVQEVEEVEDFNTEPEDWANTVPVEPTKQQKGKVSQNGRKLDGAGVKRSKKTGSGEEELDDQRFAKKPKVDMDLQDRRDSVEDLAARGQGYADQTTAYDDQNMDSHPVQYGSDEGVVPEGVYRDGARVNSRIAARGTTSSQPLKKAKISGRIRTMTSRVSDVQRDEIAVLDYQTLPKLGGSDSERGGYHNERAGQQRSGSQVRSPLSTSSKVSYSAAEYSGSKGGSPLESTVSSTPVRSSKVLEAAAVFEAIVNPLSRSHSRPSAKLNSISPSPKRPRDHDADAHSDREGARQLSHREWDDRPHSSDHEREVRGSGRDPARENGGRVREERFATSNGREGAEPRRFSRNRPDDRFWDEGRDARAGSASQYPERDYRHRDDHYREREDSVDRYRDRDRYERRGSREDRFRERDRERDRSRENWGPDRTGGDARDERYSRERSVRQDRGARPSSRESGLDKQGAWHEEARPGREASREGRDRVEEDNAEIKHEIRSSNLEAVKEDLPAEDGHDAPTVQKDDAGQRFEKTESGPPKDATSNHGRSTMAAQLTQPWQAAGATLPAGRKDSDSGAPRNGSEAQTVPTHVNSRNRVDIAQGGPGSAGLRGKSGLADVASLDGKSLEEAKHGKELKRAPEERVGAAGKAPSVAHLPRVPEGASSSLSKKEHAALGKALSEEARQLKHSADRLKNVPSMEDDIPNLYLQASLKFLQSAHHFEMASAGDGSRQGHSGQSIQLYNETARFFDFCATTFERQRDLVSAALAHNLAAVARFRGLMGTSITLNKDCQDLQSAASAAAAPGSQVAGVVTPPTGLPPPPPLALSRVEKPRPALPLGMTAAVGESPSSSSASDVDNLNNHALAGEKGLVPSVVKGVIPSPTLGPVSSSAELVPSRLQGALTRTIRNGMDVYAMTESWTKAQNATAAAEMAAGDKQKGMDAVRKVVEIGLLGNMDAVVRQVRLALEAIGH